ncbi:MAG: thioredoxin [Firmicutes bacterium]|nr:thioredoxin [Bacillota bacterium]
MIEHIDDSTFESKVLNSKGLVLVDFWAPWCGPCKMVAPVLEALATELAGDVEIKKINTDENRHSAEKYEIMSIPTLMIFKDGKLIDTIIGFIGKEQIKNRIIAAK